MKKNWKKVLSLILALSMVLGTNTGAFAAVRLGETGEENAAVRLGETGEENAAVRLGETGEENAPVRLGESGEEAPGRLGESGEHTAENPPETAKGVGSEALPAEEEAGYVPEAGQTEEEGSIPEAGSETGQTAEPEAYEPYAGPVPEAEELEPAGGSLPANIKDYEGWVVGIQDDDEHIEDLLTYDEGTNTLFVSEYAYSGTHWNGILYIYAGYKDYSADIPRHALHIKTKENVQGKWPAGKSLKLVFDNTNSKAFTYVRQHTDLENPDKTKPLSSMDTSSCQESNIAKDFEYFTLYPVQKEPDTNTHALLDDDLIKSADCYIQYDYSNVRIWRIYGGLFETVYSRDTKREGNIYDISNDNGHTIFLQILDGEGGGSEVFTYFRIPDQLGYPGIRTLSLPADRSRTGTVWVNNPESGMEYAVLDHRGDPRTAIPFGHKIIYNGSGELSFSGLDPDKEYYLIARTPTDGSKYASDWNYDKNADSVRPYREKPAASGFAIPEGSIKAKSFQIQKKDGQPDPNLRIVAVEGGLTPAGAQLEQLLGAPGLWKPFTVSMAQIHEAVTYAGGQWQAAALKPQTYYHVYAAYYYTEYKEIKLHSDFSELTPAGGIETPEARRIQLTLNASSGSVYYGDDVGTILSTELRDTSTRQGSFDPSPLQSRIRIFYADRSNAGAVSRLTRQWDGVDYPAEGDGVYSDQTRQLPVGSYCVVAFLKGLDDLYDYEPSYARSNEVTVRVEPLPVCGAVTVNEAHSSDLSYDADQQEWRLNAGKFLKWTDLETRFYLTPSGGDEAGSLRWSDSKVRYVVKKDDRELGVLENGGQGVSVNSLGFITISIEPNGASLNDPNYSYDKQTTDHNARIHVYKTLPSKSSFTVPEAEKKAKRFWLRIADQQLDRDGLLIAPVKHDSGSGNIRSIPAAMWQPLTPSGIEITQALNYDGNAWASVPLEPDTLYDIYAAYFHGDVMEGGYARVTEDGVRTPKQRKLKFILTRDKYSIFYGRTASDNLIPVLEDTTGRSFDPAALKDGIRYFYANTADAAALVKLRADWTGGAYPEGNGVYSDQSEQTQRLPAGAYIAVGFLKDLDPDDYDPLYVRSGEANFTVEPVEVYGAVSINDGHSSDLKYDPENGEWQIDIRKSIKWSDLQTVFFADQDASKECAGLAWKNEDSSKVKYQVSKDQQLLGVLEQGDAQGIPLNSSGFLDISILSGSAGLNDPNYRYKDETWTDCIRIRVCKVLPNKDDFTIDEKKAGSFKVHISNSQLDMDGLYITAIKHTASITPEVMEAMPQYLWQPLTGSVMEIRKGAEKNGVFWDMTEPLLSNTLYDVYVAYFKNGEIDSGCARITGDGFKTENPRRIRFTLKASENAIAYGRNANEIMTPVLEDESLRQNPPFDPGEVKGRIRYFYAEAGNKSAEERVLGIWDGGAYPAEGDGVYSDRNGRLAAGEYIAVGFLKGLAMDDYDPLYVSSNSVRFTVRPADVYGRIMVAAGHSPDLSYDADQQEWRMDVRKYLKWSDFTTRFFTDPGANEEIGGLSWKDNLVQYVVKKDGKVLGVLKYGDSRGVSVNTTGSIAVSISRNDAGLNNGNYGYKGPASNPCETLNAYKAVLKKSDFILPEDEKKAKSFKVRTANRQLDMDGLVVIAVDGEGSGGQIDQISKNLWQEMTSSGLELRQAVSYGNSGWYSYTPLTPDKPYDVYAAYFKGDALDSPCTKITEEGFRSAKFKEMQFDKLITGRPYIIYGETASHNLLPNLKDKNRRAGFSPQELESRIRYFYAESGNSAAEQELLQDWDGKAYPVEGGGVYSDRGEALPVGTYHAAGFLKDLDPDDYDPVYVSSNDVMFNVLPAGAYGAVSVNIGHSGELSFIPASNEWRIDAGKRITWSNLETRFFADAQRKEEIKGLCWNDSRVWYVVRQNGTELGVLKSNDTQGILLEEAGLIEISIIQNEALLNSKNYEYRGAAASNCTRIRVMAPELQITPVYTGIPYAYTLTDGHALTGFDPKGFVKVTDKRQGGLDITDDGKVAVRVYRDSAFTMEGITGAAKGDTIYFRATYNGEKAVSTKEGAVRIVEQRVGILPKDEDYALSFTTNPADEQLLGLHPHFEIKLYDEKGAAHPAGSPEYYVDGELSVAQCGLTEERFNRYDYYQEPAEVVPVFREADTLSGNYALEVGTCRIRIIPTVKVSFAGKDNRIDEKGLYYPERNELAHKSIPGISIQELWALAGGQDVYENTDKIWRAEITYDGSKDTEGRRHETVEASVDEEYIPRVPGTGYLAFEYTPSLGREYISSVELTLRFAQQKYEPNDNVNLKMDPVEDVYYNGFKHVSDRTAGTKKNTPDLGVRITSTVNGKTYRLVEGKDYTLKYKNNVEVCNIKEVKDTRKWPAVIAVGKGDYKGVSFTEYYSIRPIDPAGSYDQSGKMIWLTVTKGVNPYYQVDKNSRFSVDPVFAVASVYWDEEKGISGKRYATIEKGKIKYSVVSECRALEDAGEYYIEGAVKKAEGTYFGSRGIRMSLWAFVPEGIPEVKSGVERMEILDRNGDDFFDSFCVLPHGSAKIGAWINKYSAMEAWESTAYTCGGMKAVSANTYTGTINDKGFYTRLSVFKKDKNKTPMKAEDIEASLYDRKNGNRVWAFTEMGSVMDSTTQAGNYMLRLAPTEKAILEKGMLPEPVWLKVSFRTTQKLSKAVDPKTVITRYYTNEGAERAIGGGIQVESLSGNCGFAISINKVGALKNRIDVYSKAPGQKGETWVASIAADEAGLINRTFSPYNTTPGTYKIIFRGRGAYSQKDKVVATYQVKPMDASGVKICLSENKDPFGPEVTEIPYNAGGYTYALDAEKSPYATDAYGHVYMTLYARNGKNGAFLRSDYLTNLLRNGSAKVTIKKGRNGKLAVTIKGLRDQNGREVVKGTIKITDDMALPVRGALSSNSLVLLNKGFTKDDRNEWKKYSKKLVLVQYSAKKGIDAFGNYKTVALKYRKDYDFEAVSFNSPGSGVSANWVTFKPGTGGGFEGSASSGRMSADMGKGLIRLTGIAPIADQSYQGGQRVQPDRILVTGRIGKASKTYEIKKEDYGEGAKIDDMIFKVSFSDNRDVGKKKARVSVSVIPAGPEGLISASPKMARFTIK